jgi:G6PDH family F420-dependent oxidoreductase
MRYHPAVIAQAAATVGTMMPGRFFLGLGSGENLNEHIVGRHWPEPPIRLQMLEEAVEVIQNLWQGGWHSHHGRYFTVEYARVYTLPDPLPKILIAAAGRNTAALAGRCDGLIAVDPDHDLIEHFMKAGGSGKPSIGQFKVCWAHSTEQARRTAREWWPNAALPGDIGSELPLPRQFEQLSKLVSEDRAAGEILCGPDAVPHLDRIRKYRDAGFDSVYVHQVGPDQEGFLRFYEREVMPLARDLRNEPRKAA